MKKPRRKGSPSLRGSCIFWIVKRSLLGSERAKATLLHCWWLQVRSSFSMPLVFDESGFTDFIFQSPSAKQGETRQLGIKPTTSISRGLGGWAPPVHHCCSPAGQLLCNTKHHLYVVIVGEENYSCRCDLSATLWLSGSAKWEKRGRWTREHGGISGRWRPLWRHQQQLQMEKISCQRCVFLSLLVIISREETKNQRVCCPLMNTS